MDKQNERIREHADEWTLESIMESVKCIQMAHRGPCMIVVSRECQRSLSRLILRRLSGPGNDKVPVREVLGIQIVTAPAEYLVEDLGEGIMRKRLYMIICGE